MNWLPATGRLVARILLRDFYFMQEEVRSKRPQVQVTCLDCGVKLHGRGWPRCPECRLKLKALRKAVFREYEELGRPGDWGSYFAMVTGRPMPVGPTFKQLFEREIFDMKGMS